MAAAGEVYPGGKKRDRGVERAPCPAFRSLRHGVLSCYCMRLCDSGAVSATAYAAAYCQHEEHFRECSVWRSMQDGKVG